MPISEAGAINPAALVVPNLYVQLLPPGLLLLNGVPTSKVGIVGTASWGPIGQPVPVSSYADFVANFGPLVARAFDAGTAAAIAIQQGAQNLAIVRVADGTQAAAAATVQTTGLTLAARWTGTFGNNIRFTLSAGSQTGTWRVTISQNGSGLAPEVFDNIGLGLTANPLWVAIAAAVNNGLANQRSGSNLVVATAGASVVAPVAATVPLTGGTDGVGTVAAATLVGVDTVPRTGMYALRKTGCSVAMLADVTDATTWPTQISFGLPEGIYMILVGAAGQTVATAATAKASAGIDTRAAKLMLGDWIYWLDPTLGITRLVSPQAFAAGRLGNLSPHLSLLNKEAFGVVATQRSLTGAPYGEAELQVLAIAGIDVITNPIPRGSVFGFRFGRNTSSLASEHGDNSTRMTNFIASTLDAGMGRYVGEPTSARSLQQSETTLAAFLEALRGRPDDPTSQMIEDYRVQCNLQNNPPDRRALGYRTAQVQVRYLAITEYFLVNLEGGQAVTISRQAA